MHFVVENHNSMFEDNPDACNTENFQGKDEDSTLIPFLSEYSKKAR